MDNKRRHYTIGDVALQGQQLVLSTTLILPFTQVCETGRGTLRP